MSLIRSTCFPTFSLRMVPACLTLLVLAGCHGGGGPAPKADDGAADPVAVEVARATVQPVETTISAQGTLAAGQGASARIAVVVPGRLISVTVHEGDRVTAGQIVATLDSRPQRALANSAAAALTAARTQADAAETSARAAAVNQSNAARLAKLSLDSAVLDYAATLQQAKTALQAAEVDEARIKSGARPQEIAQSDQTVVQDRATRDRAATELDRVKYLFDKGVAPKRQLDDAQTALAVAESSLESARQQANLVRAGARAEELRAAALRVQQARETLDQVNQSGKAKVDQARVALQQAVQSELDVRAKQQEALVMRQTTAQKQADLAAAQITADYSQLRAPLSGVVTRRAANPGDMADPAVPILEITDTRALNLIANLTAEDGQRVRSGMAARVTVQDIAGRTFSGRVLSVGQVDPQTNLLTVRLAVADPRGQLKVGAFATADIIVRTQPRAVVVPKQAVVTHDAKALVFVVGADSVAHQREVTVGPEQNGNIEIVTGVKPGDRVIRMGQYEIADGAKVQAGEKGDAAASDEKGGAKEGSEKDKSAAGAEKARPEGEKP